MTHNVNTGLVIPWQVAFLREISVMDLRGEDIVREGLHRCSERKDYLLSIHLQLLWRYFNIQLPLSGRYFLARRVGDRFCKYIPIIILFLSYFSYKSLDILKKK